MVNCQHAGHRGARPTDRRGNDRIVHPANGQSRFGI